MDIEEKKERIEQLNEELEVRNSERRQLLQEINEQESRFKVGDEIKFRHGQSMKEGRVKEVLGKSCGSNSYMVIPKKKDGSDGVPVQLYWFDEDKSELID